MITPLTPGVPIGVTNQWLDLANKQDGQCGAVTVGRGLNAKPVQCNATIRGRHKLYLWPGEPDLLLCAKHYDKAKKAPKPGDVAARKNGRGREGMS